VNTENKKIIFYKFLYMMILTSFRHLINECKQGGKCYLRTNLLSVMKIIQNL